MTMNINWYPGHMKKTMDKLRIAIKKVDLVLELVDARIPISSRNPVLDKIIGDKPRIIILNKADLADEEENKRWKAQLENQKNGVLLVDSVRGLGLKSLRKTADRLLVDKFKRDEDRGIIDRTIKMMIVGIPNVGKSTLINTLANRKGAKVGNKPGVTRQNQLINTGNEMELLDTPGVLWPKFHGEEGLNLAFTGAIRDEILDAENLAYRLIAKLNSINPSYLEKRYNTSVGGKETLEIMEDIGTNRGCLIRGGLIDYEKVSGIILNEYRNGIIGRITLETVDEL